MAGRGRPPKDADQRMNPRDKPVHEWKPTEGVGWQHGDLPKPPAKLLKASRETWDIWMRAWWAAHWRPEDLPGLRHVIQLYDQVQRGAYQRAGELRLSMDTYGITPKGQQDRRWKPPLYDAEGRPVAGASPADADEQGSGEEEKAPAPPTGRRGRYQHLRSVSGS